MYYPCDHADLDRRAPALQSPSSERKPPFERIPRIVGRVSVLAAANQDLGFPVRRFPRRSLLASRSRYLIARQGLVGEPLADDTGGGVKEARPILDLAGVKPVGLLVQVAEEMEGLDADVSPFDRALQEGPEVFQTVGVDLPLT